MDVLDKTPIFSSMHCATVPMAFIPPPTVAFSTQASGKVLMGHFLHKLHNGSDLRHSTFSL